MFQHVDLYPGDPILSLVEVFKKDTRANKVNLGIGVYYDDAGRLPLLESVRRAEEARNKNPEPRPYLPMEGLAGLRSAVQRLLFGADAAVVKEGRVATIQTLGGSGALRIGADFLHRYFPESKAYVSRPTWGNHIGIFEGAGIEVGEYPYYDAATGGVLFEEMQAFFKTLPAKSILILHPCCHNPTGVDLSREEWDAVLQTIQERDLIAFMDIAYQGFAQDLEADAYPMRKAAEMGLSFFVSNSFSKNLSFYGERIGGLSAVCPSKEEADRVFSQFQFLVRRIYSSPPFHAGHITADVMNSPELYQIWVGEVAQMRDRIKAMRQKLYDVLTAKVPGRDFSYFIKQQGMFSFTGLTPEQVDRLKEEHAIYLIRNGRMCVAGLNTGNVDTIANAFAEVLK